MENASFTSLPTDVLKLILKKLNLLDISILNQVCKALQKATTTELQKKHTFYLPYNESMSRPDEIKSWSKLEGLEQPLLYEQPKIEGDFLPPRGWIKCEFKFDQLILLTKIDNKSPLILALSAKITAKHIKGYFNSKTEIENINYDENLSFHLVK